MLMNSLDNFYGNLLREYFVWDITGFAGSGGHGKQGCFWFCYIKPKVWIRQTAEIYFKPSHIRYIDLDGFKSSKNTCFTLPIFSLQEKLVIFLFFCRNFAQTTMYNETLKVNIKKADACIKTIWGFRSIYEDTSWCTCVISHLDEVWNRCVVRALRTWSLSTIKTITISVAGKYGKCALSIFILE